MKLTPNFDAAEFDVHEPWPVGKDGNRQELAQLLQWLRDLAGAAGFVTSAYRSAQHNAEVHGSETSQHLKAEAADVVFYLVPIRELAARVLASIYAGTSPAFGQLIFYGDLGHVHVSLARLGSRNGEVRYSLGLDASGARTYPALIQSSQLPTLSTAQQHAGFSLPAGSCCSRSPAGGSQAHHGGANG